MKQLLFPSLLFCLIACNSNNSSTANALAETDTNSTTTTATPSTAPKVLTINSFVPDDHEILAQKKMDFNKDGLEDVVLILKNSQEEKISDYANDKPTPRPLLFLASDQQGSLQLIARNDKAVYCVDCGGQMGDPFNDIIVDKQFVSIEHYGGSQNRWARIITFNYDNIENRWFLYEDGTETFEAITPEKSTNTSKQGNSIPFESFDIYQQASK